MAQVRPFSLQTAKVTIFSIALLSAQAAIAATNHMDCKVYEQHEQANIEAHKRADPAIHDERFDMVFYSPARNSCLASIFFMKGASTYGGILDITDGQLIWAKNYRGKSFTPANIVAMDREMDEQIAAIELPSAQPYAATPLDLLPLLLDRTMNTLPAIRNVLTEVR
jgi:hypothetical protein